ncbi:MAG TPA: response regulator [Polyangiaceae bacterium]|nr:response regulator [Polyangiaceae bacterium]
MEAAQRAPSVLIVEDEAIVAHDLRQTLAEQGFDAFAVASSAEEAIATAASKRPDVVLMDIRIKGPTDGIAAAQALRERFGTPIIYLTAHADARTLARAKSTEPSGYLLKPVKSSELKVCIELALHKRGSQQRLERTAEDERLTRERLDSIERLASLARMAAGVAHQINNPLTVVLANAELVTRELERRRAGAAPPHADVSADQQRLDETIQVQTELRLAAQRIARIVANIQFFCQPSSPPSARADVRRAIERALRQTTTDLSGCARVIQDLRPVPKVKISEAHLTEMMRQLLLNAGQAIEARAGSGNEICIHTRLVEDGNVLIELADTGCGLSPEVQRRMFEPFFTTKPLGSGTGLGLSICHGIVTSAGGRLSVEARPEGGAQVSVLVPSVDSASGQMPLVPRLGQFAARSPRLRLPSAKRLAREQRRILMVDDEPMLLRSVRRLLPEYEIVCVESAKKALALLDSGRPFDLIVSDVMMPEMSGIDFYEELCARYPDEARRVVFVTGGALGHHVGNFLGSVPNMRLEKPFAAADLRRVIEQALV